VTHPAIRLLLAMTLALFMNTLLFAGELENKVKAAYIYNFTKFVDWPNEGAESMSICYVGNDPMRTQLGELNNRQAKGRTIKIIRSRDLSAIAGCDMVFISQSEERQLGALLQHLQGKAVLTVSDIPQFTQKGGMVGFVMEQNRVKIEISQKAVRQGKLKISAKLLEVARVMP